MGRPSLRRERRTELATAFARVLARQGQEGATIAALALEADVNPGLIHHYFVDKQDLYGELLEVLMAAFRRRQPGKGSAGEAASAYGQAALALDERADHVAARAWVGLFAAAMTDRALFARIRRMLDTETRQIEKHAPDLSSADSSALLAFIVGSLVFGAFAPRRAAGFAAPAYLRLLAGLRSA